MPERAELERVYRYLRSKKEWTGALEQLCYFLEQPRISYIRLRAALETLRQAGLIGLTDTGDSLKLTLLPVDGKVKLEDTPIMQYLHSHGEKVR